MYHRAMPPAPGDHEARRRDVSEAVWRVLASGGFGHLTLRAVAAEMGVSTGMLTHYFATKQALVRYAHTLAEQNTNVPVRPAEGLSSLRAALLDVLALTPEATAMNRVWVSFWDAAIGDPELGARETARYQRWRHKLRPHVEAALAAGEIPASPDTDDTEDIVIAAAALAHGIVVQALFDPHRFPPDRQIQLIDNHLRMLSADS
jgi:AcrR family transcriptional regulator